MGNIIDANILGRFRGPNIGKNFSNILTNVGAIDTLRENRELAPFRKQQAIDTQAQRQAQTKALELGNLNTREQQRLV